MQSTKYINTAMNWGLEGTKDAIQGLNSTEDFFETSITEAMNSKVAKQLISFLKKVDTEKRNIYKVKDITDIVPGLDSRFPTTLLDFESLFDDVKTTDDLDSTSMEYLFNFFGQLKTEDLFLTSTEKRAKENVTEQVIEDPVTNEDIFGTNTISSLEDEHLQPDDNFELDLYGDAKIPHNTSIIQDDTEDQGNWGSY